MEENCTSHLHSFWATVGDKVFLRRVGTRGMFQWLRKASACKDSLESPSLTVPYGTLTSLTLSKK